MNKHIDSFLYARVWVASPVSTNFVARLVSNSRRCGGVGLSAIVFCWMGLLVFGVAATGAAMLDVSVVAAALATLDAVTSWGFDRGLAPVRLSLKSVPSLRLIFLHGVRVRDGAVEEIASVFHLGRDDTMATLFELGRHATLEQFLLEVQGLSVAGCRFAGR